MGSLHTILEQDIFPTVIKPNRYTGNELNVLQKDHTAVDVKVVFAFPDIYELGMSYLGLAILYHILNRREDVLAERVYTPWVDMEEKMRQRGIPLFALESKQPLQEFDIIAFTLPYELCYTNILRMLELAALPLKSEERNESNPLIIAGGMGAFNPEPLAEFIDAFVVGDGEEVIIEIVELVKALKGSPRQELFRALSELQGVYVPSLYSPEYDGVTFKRLVPTMPSAPTPICSRTTEALILDNYPDRPLVPFTEIEHDRLTIEIMRGCPRRCRFCNASVFYRPLRERPLKEIMRQAETAIANTGYDEISLLSLSTTDYSNIEELISTLNDRFSKKRVAVALPSLRPDTFSRQLAKTIQTVRKSGLTFAPEAGTERLRQVIKKSIRDDDLFTAAEIAYESGWNVIKLYFMIGLPTEKQEDIEAIVHLVQEVVRLGKRYGSEKHVNVALSPFSPKAHTPFQWVVQEETEKLEEKSTYVMDRLQHRRAKVKWRSPEVSFIESIFARGDRRLSHVLLKAKELGCRLDAWSDFFSYSLWAKAFEEADIDPYFYTSGKDVKQPLPWDHIDVHISKDILAREWERSQKDQEGSDSAILSTKERETRIERRTTSEIREVTVLKEPHEFSYGRSRKKKVKTPLQVAKAKVRMKYEKGWEVRFLSHLDLVRVFERALRRAELPISYSHGFHPHPKIAFGPPLSVGMTSRAEYIDMQFEQPYSWSMINALNQVLPHGLVINEAKPIFGKTVSLSSTISQAEYLVLIGPRFKLKQIQDVISNLLEQTVLWVQRKVKKEVRRVNIRPHILDLTAETEREGTSVRFRVRSTDTGHAKPSEVLSTLLSLSQDEVSIFPTERIEQYNETDEQLIRPMDCI